MKDKLYAARHAFEEEVSLLLSDTDRDRWLRTISNDAEVAGSDIFYVQPGHYLCLGDNSAQSSDSRSWGLVPERLMLGKAVFVFFPPARVGFIK